MFEEKYSVDIRCEWTGTRDQLEEHLTECMFEKFRPVLMVLQEQIDASLVLQNDLQEKLEQQSEDIDFLLTVINLGNLMHKKCIKPFNRCRFPHSMLKRWTSEYYCKLCDKEIRVRRNVAMHACSNKSEIECICRKCYDKQYHRPIEGDDDQSTTDDEQ